MSHSEGVNVFEKFLGLEGPADNPVTMLALTPEHLSEGGIVKALQARLTQVAAHPEGMSPEADEVRLALHAAAARLLDPSARRQAKGATEAGPEAPSAAEPTPLEAAILLTMATMGGWNKRSRDRIGVLAQAYGVPAEQVVELAESLVGRVPVSSHTRRSDAGSRPATLRAATGLDAGASALSPAQASSLTTDVADLQAIVPGDDPSTKIVRNLVIGGGLALLGTAALIVLSVTLMSGGSNTTATGTTPAAPEPVVAEKPTAELFPVRPKEERAKPATQVRTTRIGDWDDLLRDASDAASALDTDSDAAEKQFEKVYALMSHKWSETSGDGLIAGVDRIIEFLYRAGPKQGVAERAVGLMAAGAAPLSGKVEFTAEQVQAAAWSAGVLARVGREKDLPSSVRNRVQEALGEVFPGSTGPGESSFKSGCVAALSAMPPKLVSPGPIANDAQVKSALDNWKAWLAGLAAVGGKDSPLYTRTVLLALDGLVTGGADPAQNRAVFESIGLLTTSVSWRKDDESRRWLLRWFEASNVASTDLYALTAALANQSGAEGVDTSMVLSGTADESARAEMRDRYAAVWGLRAGESRDALMQRWIDAAKTEIEASQPVADPIAIGQQVLQLARFNRAATQLWAGELGDITDLLTPIAPSVPIGQSSSVRDLIRRSSNSMEWLVQYVAAGHNITARRELLAQVVTVPNPASAEILVEEACRGSPAQVREDARMIIIKFNGSAAVLNALLEFAPMMPVTRENSQFVENVTLASLPPVRDPTWRVAVRRALLERLSEAIAGQGDLARVDAICEEVARLYADEPSPKGDAANPESAAPDATPVAVETPAIEVAVLQHRLRWQKEAELLMPSTREPLNLFQIDQLRRARLELASGKVQEFQVEQLTACELLAYVCVAEHPEKSADAAKILSELGDERRAAKHVFEQLRAVERAKVKLWMLRFPEKKA